MKLFVIEGKFWFGSVGEMIVMVYMKMNKNCEVGMLFVVMVKDEGVFELICLCSV